MTNQIILVQKNDTSYRIIKRKRFALGKTKVSVSGKKVLIKSLRPSLVSRNSNFYIIDIDAGLILFNNVDLGNSEAIDMLFFGNIVKQLVESAEKKFDKTSFFIHLATGLGIGLFVGYLLKGFF